MTNGDRHRSIDEADRAALAGTDPDAPTPEIRDTEDRLDTYDPTPGATFLAVDTEAVFVADGDAWHRLASTGRSASFDEVRTGTFRSVSPGVRTGPRGFARINHEYRSSGVSVEAGYTKPTFAWIFDGGALNTYEHREVFVDAGVKPVLALSTGSVGGEDAMTWDHVRELQSAYGWGVTNHGHDHERLDELPRDAIEDEVVTAIETFAREGVHHHHYVYPWGESGGEHGRAVVSELYPYAWGSVDVEETAGIVDVESPFDMPRSLVENRPMDAVEAAVDRAIENDTGLVVFGHNVVDGGPEDEGRFETSVERIEHLAAYVREQGGEWVDSLDEVVRYSHTPITITSQDQPVRVDRLSVRAAAVAEVGVGASLGSAQEVPPEQTTVVPFDETRYDHRDEFDATAGRVVTAERGTFRIGAAVQVEGLPATSSCRVAVRVDGDPAAVHEGAGVEAGPTTLRVDATLELDAGTAVDVAVTHEAGERATIRPGPERTRFEVSKLG